MRLQSTLFILLVSFLMIGCAHTQSPTAVNSLQIKVAQLERKVLDRDRQITDLQAQVQSLDSQLSEIDTIEYELPAEDYTYRQPERRTYQAQTRRPYIEDTYTEVETYVEPVVRKEPAKKDTRIIRVSASARDIQQALKNAGYYTGKIDGKFGRQSKKAVTAFQTDHNLKADGIIGRATWGELKTYLE